MSESNHPAEEEDVKFLTLPVKQEENPELAWRRNKVMELLSKGMTQREIANELVVSEPTISRDVHAITEQIYAEHDQWVRHVFRENQIAQTGINLMLADLWRIVQNPRIELADKFKAYLLIMECYHNKLRTVYSKQFTRALKNQYEEWLAKEQQHQYIMPRPEGETA